MPWSVNSLGMLSVTIRSTLPSLPQVILVPGRSRSTIVAAVRKLVFWLVIACCWMRPAIPLEMTQETTPSAATRIMTVVKVIVFVMPKREKMVI